ncbi:MAG: L,D-transpeptidase [Gammaproteobacteria bacterium]
MFALITSTLAVILMLISHSAFALPISYTLCKDTERFTCYTVKRSDSWEKLFSDPRKKDLVKRINRMNIELDRGMKIAIPKNMNGELDIMDYSPFPKQIAALGEKTIFVSINPAILAWGAYDSGGTLQAWGPVSGGKGWCPDVGRHCNTSLGKFEVYRKEGRHCVSTKFPVGRGGAPMPYCMFFNGGFALHGSYDVPGYNDSHGCIRLFVPDASWLNKNFVEDADVPVIVSNQI